MHTGEYVCVLALSFSLTVACSRAVEKRDVPAPERAGPVTSLERLPQGSPESALLPELSLGMSHTCALLDGTAYCWGSDNRGQLGNGRTGYSEVERLDAVEPLNLDARVEQIVAGSENTCARLEGGSVRCWGIGTLGQHGTQWPYDVDRAEDATDAAIGGPATHIDASGVWACSLMREGNVRCWGAGKFFGLGYGNLDNIGDDETPESVGDVPIGGKVVQLAVDGHICVLLDDGAIKCWGLNTNGQLGYGHTDGIGDDETPADVGPVDVGGRATQVVVGSEHTCALLERGRVRCWGWAHHGTLGYGNQQSIGDDEAPAAAGDVNVGGMVTQLAAGDLHTCALLDGGRVRCWGLASSGQLGYGNEESIGDDEEPAAAGDVNIGGKAVRIVAGDYRTCAVLEGGRVRCWGGNENAELGYPHEDHIGDDEDPATAGDVPLPGSIAVPTVP